MIGVQAWAEIRRLHRVGRLSIREIGRPTGLHRERSASRRRDVPPLTGIASVEQPTAYAATMRSAAEVVAHCRTDCRAPRRNSPRGPCSGPLGGGCGGLENRCRSYWPTESSNLSPSAKSGQSQGWWAIPGSGCSSRRDVGLPLKAAGSRPWGSPVRSPRSQRTPGGSRSNHPRQFHECAPMPARSGGRSVPAGSARTRTPTSSCPGS